MSIQTKSPFQQIETSICNADRQIKEKIFEADKKIKEAKVFDKIGETAVKKGCLTIGQKESQLNTLKKKKFKFLSDLPQGLGLLALAATIAVVAAILITSFPIFPVIFPMAVIGGFAFIGSIVGIDLIDSGLSKYREKDRTQSKIINLYDQIDTAKNYLKNNAEKIKEWVEVQKGAIEEELGAFQSEKVSTVNVKKLRERLALCKNLTNVLPKTSIAA
jgi:hypothetical protein